MQNLQMAVSQGEVVASGLIEKAVNGAVAPYPVNRIAVRRKSVGICNGCKYTSSFSFSFDIMFSHTCLGGYMHCIGFYMSNFG